MTIDISLRLAIRRAQTALPPVSRFRFCWDDENSDYGFKCRTLTETQIKTDNPPAVIRYSPVTKEGAGDFRVDVSAWKAFVIALNGGGEEGYRRWEYWCGKARAQFNGTGWPMLAYVGMCGNYLQGVRQGDWFRFETLKPGDLQRAQGMTRATHPHLIHTFTCVTWSKNETTGEFYTKHILSTGTPRGIVDYPLITREGYAFIPARHIVEERI
jgi:hypothetical protein